MATRPTGGELVDIVVGLAPDGYADDVAEVAVERAVELGARLRFIQVVDPDLVGADRDEADRATFRNALRALRGHRGVPGFRSSPATRPNPA